MGCCNSFEENEFLISIEINFHNSNIFDICIALIKHYRKVIHFMNYFFPYSYWYTHCSQWLNSLPIVVISFLLQILISTSVFYISENSTAFTPLLKQMWKSSLFPLPTSSPSNQSINKEFKFYIVNLSIFVYFQHYILSWILPSLSWKC